MKTKLQRTFLWMTTLLVISTFATSSINPGYDEFGNDIDECQQNPCPEGYTCRNLPGSYVCIAPEGEIIEGGDGGKNPWPRGYKVHHGDCSFEADIDAKGYVTIFGIRKFVGLNGTGVYRETYYAVSTDCEMGGSFLCQPYTCAKFWLEKK